MPPMRQTMIPAGIQKIAGMTMVLIPVGNISLLPNNVNSMTRKTLTAPTLSSGVKEEKAEKVVSVVVDSKVAAAKVEKAKAAT